MNIGIDIDDTLTNSFEYFQPYVAEFFGVSLAEIKERNISYSNLPEEWAKYGVDFCKKYYDHIVEDTPFKKDAAKIVKKLRFLGHKIVIITGRTTLLYTDPYKTTTKELEKGGIEYDKLICTFEKDKACVDEKIDILIDDLVRNCLSAEKVGVKAVIFTSAENKEKDTHFTRIDDWNQIFDVI